jgi:predicted DNA-binding protein (MmcQ/YjbR family)
MAWEQLLAYCLARPGAWQDESWERDVVVKVGPKIFAFLGSPAGGTAARTRRSLRQHCACPAEWQGTHSA